MIPESTVHITDKPLSSAVSLREGSFVFVRVIGEKPDGTYTVSFEGSRFSVRADKPMKAGDAFPAKLTTDGRKLILLPDFSRGLSRAANNSKNLNNSNIFDINKLSDTDAAQYFNSLGLVPDELSRRIVSFMQLMGIRLDTDKAAFIREIAKKFPGHEQEAAEAAVILEEKGLPVTEEAVERLLGMISGCGSADNGFTAGVNAAEEDTEHWIIIPYEYKGVDGTSDSLSEVRDSSAGRDGIESFYGSICLLKEPDGTVSRLKLTARKGEKLFLFKIYLNYCINRTKIYECTVEFTVQPQNGNPGRIAEKLKTALAGAAEKIIVRYEPDPDIMYLSDNDIALVRAEA
ncbi:MAG: hypothetical protein J5747_06540 [Spirochaetaceae bacterium]|nr:hypothetical protein [Spirochaetaceae bacterium]